MGAVDYFLKPVRPEALLARLGQYTFTTKVKERHVKVLAIDDDPAARELVVEALAPVWIRGRAPPRLAARVSPWPRQMPPELVICDLLMPDIDGFEVVSSFAAIRRRRMRPS